MVRQCPSSERTSGPDCRRICPDTYSQREFLCMLVRNLLKTRRHANICYDAEICYLCALRCTYLHLRTHHTLREVLCAIFMILQVLIPLLCNSLVHFLQSVFSKAGALCQSRAYTNPSMASFSMCTIRQICFTVHAYLYFSVLATCNLSLMPNCLISAV